MIREAHQIIGLAAFTTQSVTLWSGAGAKSADAAFVNGDYSHTLGITAAHGRLLTADDETERDGAVAVISHTLWQSTFGAREDVIGRRVPINGTPVTIIGVAPQGFGGLGVRPVDVWMSLALWPAMGGDQFALKSWSAAIVEMVTRISTQAPAIAAEQITRTLRDAGDPLLSASTKPVSLIPLYGIGAATWDTRGRVVGTATALSFLLLVIGTANFAGAFAVRAIVGRHEALIRLALGAGRKRLMFDHCLDVALAAVIAGVMGYTLSTALVLAARDVLQTSWRFSDLRSLGWAAVLTFGSVAAASAAGILQIAHAETNAALISRATTGGRRISAWHHLSVLALQSGLAVVLLFAAVASARTFDRLLRIGMRGRSAGLYVASVDLGNEGRPAEVAQAFMALKQTARVTPNVVDASIASTTPFGNRLLADVSTGPVGQGATVALIRVDEDFVPTAKLRLLVGRNFDAADRMSEDPPVLVDETLARTLSSDDSAVHRCLIIVGTRRQQCLRVVGVVEDQRLANLTDRELPALYLPLRSEPSGLEAALWVRSIDDDIAPALQRRLQRAWPNLPYVRVVAVSALLQRQLRPWRLAAMAFTAFALIAVTLASAGLYGSARLLIAQQAHALAVRRALGAPLGALISDALGQAIAVICGGGALGAATILGALPQFGRLFGEPSTVDLVALGAGIGILCLCVLGALLVPALIVVRVDPANALRAL